MTVVGSGGDRAGELSRSVRWLLSAAVGTGGTGDPWEGGGWTGLGEKVGGRRVEVPWREGKWDGVWVEDFFGFLEGVELMMTPWG